MLIHTRGHAVFVNQKAMTLVDLDGKAKLPSRKDFRLRIYHVAEIGLYHTLGTLPEPEFTHRFC